MRNESDRDRAARKMREEWDRIEREKTDEHPNSAPDNGADFLLTLQLSTTNCRYYSVNLQRNY